jgi:hypothetical protein
MVIGERYIQWQDRVMLLKNELSVNYSSQVNFNHVENPSLNQLINYCVIEALFIADEHNIFNILKAQIIGQGL